MPWATIPCDTNGFAPCSDCCGSDHDTADRGSVGSSPGGVGSPAGASSGGEFAADVTSQAVSLDDTTDTVTSSSEPTPEDMSDAADALDMMGELYATGQVLEGTKLWAEKDVLDECFQATPYRNRKILTLPNVDSEIVISDLSGNGWVQLKKRSSTNTPTLHQTT